MCFFLFCVLSSIKSRLNSKDLTMCVHDGVHQKGVQLQYDICFLFIYITFVVRLNIYLELRGVKSELRDVKSELRDKKVRIARHKI